MHLNLFKIAVLAALLFFSSCKSKKQDNNSARSMRSSGPITVDGFIVTPHSVSDNIEIPGSLLPFEETQIRSEVSGRITQLNIQEGMTVKQGTLMVKLFDQDLQAQLKKLEVQLQIKQKTSERNRELLGINGISQQEYDLSTLDVDNLRADIETTKISIGKTEIRAPYTGSVGLRNVSLGSYLSPSDVITTIRQIDKLKLEFSVPEKYAKDITKGYVVKFKVDGGKDYHKATVMATENRVDQNTRTLKIRAVVNESHPELVPGIFAKINLQLGRDNNALMVPSQAVIPQARGKQVILLRKDSAQFINIETGIRDSVYVQITNGLHEGDTVITSGLMSIRPNAKIKVTKVNHYQ
jgi:membrane fusion protein (multidrug efflux system)